MTSTPAAGTPSRLGSFGETGGDGSLAPAPPGAVVTGGAGAAVVGAAGAVVDVEDVELDKAPDATSVVDGRSSARRSRSPPPPEQAPATAKATRRATRLCRVTGP